MFMGYEQEVVLLTTANSNLSLLPKIKSHFVFVCALYGKFSVMFRHENPLLFIKGKESNSSSVPAVGS